MKKLVLASILSIALVSPAMARDNGRDNHRDWGRGHGKPVVQHYDRGHDKGHRGHVIIRQSYYRPAPVARYYYPEQVAYYAPAPVYYPAPAFSFLFRF